MAEIFEVHLSDGATWTYEVSSSDYIGFGGSGGAQAPISQDAYQSYTIKTDATMSVNNGTGQNNRYVSATQLSINGGPDTTLLFANVSQAEVSSRWHYQDDAASTALSNVRFFAYNGSVTTAPSNVTIVAYEHDTPNSAINKDNDSAATPNGRAWDNSYGIGAIANALILEDQASASDHYFYIGLSVKPTARGLNANITFRLEFDVA